MRLAHFQRIAFGHQVGARSYPNWCKSLPAMGLGESHAVASVPGQANALQETSMTQISAVAPFLDRLETDIAAVLSRLLSDACAFVDRDRSAAKSCIDRALA